MGRTKGRNRWLEIQRFYEKSCRDVNGKTEIAVKDKRMEALEERLKRISVIEDYNGKEEGKELVA